MANPIRLGVNGAAGRMGQRIVLLGYSDPDFHVVAAIESSHSEHLGDDAGEVAGIGSIGVPIQTELSNEVDVVIDFSTPEGTRSIAEACAGQQIPLVVATTGLEESQREELLRLAETTPMLMAPSMSVAVNLVMKLVRDAARALSSLPSGVDVEIVERHHRFKEDAPSGTALKFGEIIAGEMGQTDHVHGRHGRLGQRRQSEIGYHALRTGDNVGEHTIVFGMMGETIDLDVRSHTRDTYGYGALAAAKFLVGQPAGLYSMNDVLGL